MSSHISFLAGDKTEVLKDLHNGQLHHQDSKSHANTVPWSSSKRQEGVGIYVVFVLFAEPKKEQ